MKGGGGGWRWMDGGGWMVIVKLKDRSEPIKKSHNEKTNIF